MPFYPDLSSLMLLDLDYWHVADFSSWVFSLRNSDHSLPNEKKSEALEAAKERRSRRREGGPKVIAAAMLPPGVKRDCRPGRAPTDL